MIQERQFYTKDSYIAIGQWDNWCNLLDMANAVRYGFTQYRLPKPGQPIDVQDAEKRVKHIEEEWAWECGRRGGEFERPSPDFSSLSIEAKCYLHSILEPSDIPVEENSWWGF